MVGTLSTTQDFQFDYRISNHSCDAHFRHRATVYLNVVPLQTDVLIDIHYQFESGHIRRYYEFCHLSNPDYLNPSLWPDILADNNHN